MDVIAPGNNDIWCIIATGQSLKKEDVDYVRGKCKVIAVSNSYQIAPWADILVSHDENWWRRHPEALKFAGDKYARVKINGVNIFKPSQFPRGCNSGLMAMIIARDKGAKKLLLLGFDMHGTHYFGPHPAGLKNTTAKRFKEHIQQFALFSGCEVINCTPNSALKRYPFARIQDVL